MAKIANPPSPPIFFVPNAPKTHLRVSNDQNLHFFVGQKCQKLRKNTPNNFLVFAPNAPKSHLGVTMAKICFFCVRQKCQKLEERKKKCHKWQNLGGENGDKINKNLFCPKCPQKSNAKNAKKKWENPLKFVFAPDGSRPLIQCLYTKIPKISL